MNLLEQLRYREVKADGSINWISPQSPGAESYGGFVGLMPISTQHPPSLKNPQRVKVQTAQDGWRRGDSKASRDRAMRDLIEVHKRLRRQIGKPTISHTALFDPKLYDSY